MNSSPKQFYDVGIMISKQLVEISMFFRLVGPLVGPGPDQIFLPDQIWSGLIDVFYICQVWEDIKDIYEFIPVKNECSTSFL